MTEERIKQLEEELAKARVRETELLHRCDLLEAELAALKEAVRPVVDDWTENRSTALDTSTDKEVGYVVATFEQLDALAALVGEE